MRMKAPSATQTPAYKTRNSKPDSYYLLMRVTAQRPRHHSNSSKTSIRTCQPIYTTQQFKCNKAPKELSLPAWASTSGYAGATTARVPCKCRGLNSSACLQHNIRAQQNCDINRGQTQQQRCSRLWKKPASFRKVNECGRGLGHMQAQMLTPQANATSQSERRYTRAMSQLSDCNIACFLVISPGTHPEDSSRQPPKLTCRIISLNVRHRSSQRERFHPITPRSGAIPAKAHEISWCCTQKSQKRAHGWP